MSDIIHYLPIVLALVLTGVLAGTLAGLLGIGGGIVIVPVLFFLFQWFGVSLDTSMVVATSTSLAVIVPTSIASIRAHNKKGNVDWALIRQWAAFIVLGVIAGAYLVMVVDGRYFTFVFAALAFFVALRFLLPARKTPSERGLPAYLWQAIIALWVGLISVMVGIGGGALGVAILSSFNFSMHRAVGTASMFGFIIALPGALLLLLSTQAPVDAPPGTYGYVNWLAFIILIPLTVLFAPIGARLGQAMNSDRLKRIFGIILMLTALRMVAQVIWL